MDDILCVRISYCQFDYGGDSLKAGERSSPGEGDHIFVKSAPSCECRSKCS
jgi:hypothetical protein